MRENYFDVSKISDDVKNSADLDETEYTGLWHVANTVMGVCYSYVHSE